MQIRVTIPFALDKNLGRVYNEEMGLIGEDDWSCFHDHDTTFLVPDSINILYEYVKRYPDTGVFTCFTNRVSTLSAPQLLGGRVSDNSDITDHIKMAERQKKFLYQVTEINRDISGFLMLISKKVWRDFQFSEDLKCLGVDTEWNRRLREGGKKILRMDGLYMWHSYRLTTGIHYKAHLQ